MDNITNTMTAERMSQTPSYFGMPAGGHVTVASPWITGRSTGSVKGDMGLVPATATFLGTPAWSPPTS